MIINIISLIFGFLILIKGADALISGSISTAKKLNVGALTIGLTIVALGTSFPELFISITSSIEGGNDLMMGNLLGSNIANILLIMGIVAVSRATKISHKTVWREIPIIFLLTSTVWILTNSVNLSFNKISLSRWDGLVLIIFFVFFMYYAFSISRRKKDISMEPIKELSSKKTFFLIALGLSGLILGSRLVVDGALYIANIFSIKESFIGLTIVALGTSLPELITTIVASRRKEHDIVIGNIIGSNIINLSLILGSSLLIRPIPNNPSMNLSFSVAVCSSLLLFVFMFIGRRHVLQRWQGLLFLSFYFIYLLFLIF